MKKLFIALIFFIPMLTLAHTGDDSSADDSGSFMPGYMMMHEIEDQAVGDEQHEEMEELMIKMMNGTLTDEEESRVIEFMNENPGPWSMMMQRYDDGIAYGGYNHPHMGYGDGYGLGMHGGYFGGFLGIIFWVFIILAIAALAKFLFSGRSPAKASSSDTN